MSTLATQAPPATLLERSIDMLACPYCGAGVAIEGESVRCKGCSRSFNIDSGIPQLFAPNDPEAQKGDVTEIVKSFSQLRRHRFRTDPSGKSPARHVRPAS
jgi:uncharacterized protein YbaR (Trm112 family)